MSRSPAAFSTGSPLQRSRYIYDTESSHPTRQAREQGEWRRSIGLQVRPRQMARIPRDTERKTRPNTNTHIHIHIHIHCVYTSSCARTPEASCGVAWRGFALLCQAVTCSSDEATRSPPGTIPRLNERIPLRSPLVDFGQRHSGQL